MHLDPRPERTGGRQAQCLTQTGHACTAIATAGPATACPATACPATACPATGWLWLWLWLWLCLAVAALVGDAAVDAPG